MHLLRVASWSFVLIWLAALPANAAEAVPDFMSGHSGWQVNDAEPGGSNFDFHPVPGEKARPMTYDLAHPYVTNGDVFHRPPYPRIADLTNPILQPWTRQVIKATNDSTLKLTVLPFGAEQRCWPPGVPAGLLHNAPAYYLQTPHEVVLFTQRGQDVRRIYLDTPHSAAPGYSWNGESVGHYVNGDTLAIDTVGLDDKGPLDNYRTPHTKKLHVVETHQVDGERTRMFINITVDDPGAFTMPWKAWKIFRRVAQAPWDEIICAEGNPDFFNEQPVPMPHAVHLDF